MGTHPNAMLICIFTPDDLARKTYRAILTHAGLPEDSDNGIKIGTSQYHHQVMESDYDDSYQISAPEGSIVIHGFVTYGDGEKISWDKLHDQRNQLKAWALEIDELFKCKHEIFISANYW